MTKPTREFSIDELDAVSGGGLDIGRPFLPTILTKPTSSPKPTGSPTSSTSTTSSTTHPSASFDPVTIRF